ncbi:TIR domain-containing protein [Zoogloea sp.]|uniref:TIR domain-containing protein n=1 Tax=Zoogloea sp. TaxID=49181 RepID=UPI0035B0BDFB
MTAKVFISHASEDKELVAQPLAAALRNVGIDVWLDQFELKVGDSLRQSIDRGLGSSRFGVVVLSPSFFAKRWPQRELDALLAKEVDSASVVLPVWHHVSAEQVRASSPVLADRLAVSTDAGIEEVARKLVEAIVLQTQRDSDLFESRLEGALRASESALSAQKRPESDRKDEVFIVHGHDNAAKESVARFIEKVGAKAVILNEQASLGLTVLEKFEKHSHIRFAVALLTPDDAAHAVSHPGEERLRARQNVIFEMGFFLGKLGRGGMCAMYRGELEIPSDIAGVVQIELDSASGWQIYLARELRRAGVRIDLNRVLD